MKIIETMGVIILVFVCLGLTQAPWGIISHDVPVVIMSGLFVLLIIVAIVTSSFKIAGAVQNNSFDMTFSTILIATSAVVYFGISRYFQQALSLPWGNYWYLVSYYSLPAIALEGGMFRLFSYIDSRVALSVRERRVFTAGIITYIMVALTTNFLAIGGVIPIEHQLLFSRIVLVVTLGVGLTGWLRTRNAA